MLVWAAVLIAAAAAAMLGVVAVTAGLAAASGLAGLVVGFCELVAVTLAILGWVGERRSATEAAKEEPSISLPSAGRPAPSRDPASGHSSGKYAVTLGDSNQGTMIGDGNVQNIDLRYSHRNREHPGAGESS